MKTLFLACLSLILKTTVFGQKQLHNDSLIARFDLLNNRPFTELQLEDTTGNIFNTATLSGKTIYVDFWFTACSPCLKEIPSSQELQQYFATDTNVVFLSICIENIQRKTFWKQVIKEKQMPGIQLFYARNRPQKINLLRQYKIIFPTYLLINKEMKVIGYDAPRPSEKNWVRWAITKAKEGKYLSESFRDVINSSKAYKAFVENNGLQQ